MIRRRLVTVFVGLVGLSGACSNPTESKLRAEVGAWKGVPYRDNGTTRDGVGNAGFVGAVFKTTMGTDIPMSYDEQLRTGKLVDQKALAPGDLAFFEGAGIGPFRSHWVGIYLGGGEIAIARRESGITIARLADAPWSTTFKTGRHISTDPNAKPPVFDAASYGNNRAALLRDIAKAWVGTLYRQGGKTFDGIGNDEFVRSVYEGIYDEELSGTPAQWVTMGDPAERESLEPGDIILYEAVGIGSLFNRRHAGIYIGNNEFVHAVKGSAVTISNLDEDRWKTAFRAARRINPDVLARTRAAAGAKSVAPAKPASTSAATRQPGHAPAQPAAAPAQPAGTDASSRSMSDLERKFREAAERWRGTPYKWGGETKAGIDCSAFVKALYSEVAGTQLPRGGHEQERLGAKVERPNLQTGDLVFFKTQGMGPLFRSLHVGLYLGGGEFAQSSGSKGVTISRLDNYYWNKKYSTARRVPR